MAAFSKVKCATRSSVELQAMRIPWRRQTSFWLEFDPETLELVRLIPMDSRGTAPASSPDWSDTLVRTMKAKDEASLRRAHDFKSIGLLLRAEREARREDFKLVIDAYPDPAARRALQLGMSEKRTIEQAAAEVGCSEGLVSYALSSVYMEVTKRRHERQCHCDAAPSSQLLRAVVARLLGRKPKAKREPPGQRLSQRFDRSGPRVRLVVFHLS